MRDQLCVSGGFLDRPGLKVSDADLLSSLMRVRKAVRVHITPHEYEDVIVQVNGWVGPYCAAVSAMHEDTRQQVIQHGGLNCTPQEFTDLYCAQHFDVLETPFIVHEREGRRAYSIAIQSLGTRCRESKPLECRPLWVQAVRTRRVC